MIQRRPSGLVGQHDGPTEPGLGGGVDREVRDAELEEAVEPVRQVVGHAGADLAVRRPPGRGRASACMNGTDMRDELEPGGRDGRDDRVGHAGHHRIPVIRRPSPHVPSDGT